MIAVNVAGSLIIVPSISPGGIVVDATLVMDATLVRDAIWDAFSSYVSCFEPFLVTLFVACDCAMVNVFVLSSGLSNLWELSEYFVKKVFGLRQSRVRVARPVKVFGSDKLIN